MSQENVFLFYSYAEIVNETLNATVKFAEDDNVDPDVVADLQLETVGLKENIGDDFLIIKLILSEINNLLALWVHTGIPKDLSLFVIVIVLILLLELLSLNYSALAKQSGFDFNYDEVKFILVGQTLDTVRNNAVKLVRNSSVVNSVVDDKEKLVESILTFGKLGTKFSRDDVLDVIAKLN